MDYKVFYKDGDFYEGKKVTVEIDGKTYTRRVYYRKDCGLYIIVGNRMYFECECKY